MADRDQPLRFQWEEALRDPARRPQVFDGDGDRPMRVSEVAVALALATYVDVDTGHTWVGVRTLAGAAACSRHTVMRALSTLADAGVVRRSERRHGAKSDAWLVPPAEWPGAGTVTAAVAEKRSQRATASSESGSTARPVSEKRWQGDTGLEDRDAPRGEPVAQGAEAVAQGAEAVAPSDPNPKNPMNPPPPRARDASPGGGGIGGGGVDSSILSWIADALDVTPSGLLSLADEVRGALGRGCTPADVVAAVTTDAPGSLARPSGFVKYRLAHAEPLDTPPTAPPSLTDKLPPDELLAAGFATPGPNLCQTCGQRLDVHVAALCIPIDPDLEVVAHLDGDSTCEVLVCREQAIGREPDGTWKCRVHGTWVTTDDEPARAGSKDTADASGS